MTSLRMPDDHAWRTEPGYKIVVADRGAARFDVPQAWQPVQDATADVCLADAQPPDDTVRLQFTLLPVRVPRGTALPPASVMLEGVIGEEWQGRRGPVRSERRAGLDLAWIEADDVDTENGRPILTRTCTVVGGGRVALFTLACYADRPSPAADAWRVLRTSVELGRSYDLSGRDPRRN